MRLAHFLGIVIVLLFFVVPALAVFVWDVPLSVGTAFANENLFLTAFLFTFFSFAATVVAPFTATPAIPIAAAILHPALVAVLSVIGWTLGAIVAFLLARHYGRPLLGKFVSMESIDRYEKRISPHLGFFALVLLRMVLPVDVLSYAVGLASNMSLLTYTLATIVGITPFAFVFAYTGAAFFAGDVMSLLLYGIGGVLLFIVVWYLFRAVHKTYA